MKKLCILLLLLLFVGCKGKQGDKGDNGIQGLRGPSGDETDHIEVLSGSMSSDDFYVNDNLLAQASNCTVFIVLGSGLVQLPIYNFTENDNILFAWEPLNSRVRILNGVLSGASGYVIVLYV